MNIYLTKGSLDKYDCKIWRLGLRDESKICSLLFAIMWNSLFFNLWILQSTIFFNFYFYDKFSFFNLLLAILQNQLPLKYSILQSSAQVEKLKYCALQHFIEKEVKIPKRFLCVRTGSICEGWFSIDLIHCYPFISARGASLQFWNPLIPCKTPYFEDACLQLDDHGDGSTNWCGNQK